jgi:uncharacterized membrane protein YphA (DoxX/SURF4 family)
VNALWALLRVGLGLAFVYASLDKVAHPAAFVALLRNYQLVPEALLNPVAIVLPWMEAVCGAALALGLLRRGAALVVCGLMAVFMAALGLNLARGLDVACGCFSVDPAHSANTTLSLLRDLGLFAVSVLVLWRTRRESSARN